MSDASPDTELVPPEISWEASLAIESWRKILGNANGDHEGLFERAAVELLRVAAKEGGPDGRQTIAWRV